MLALQIHRRLDEHNAAAFPEESHSSGSALYLHAVKQCVVGHDFVVRGLKVFGMRQVYRWVRSHRGACVPRNFGLGNLVSTGAGLCYPGFTVKWPTKLLREVDIGTKLIFAAVVSNMACVGNTLRAFFSSPSTFSTRLFKFSM